MLEKTGRKQHLLYICALNLISWTPPVKRFTENFQKIFQRSRNNSEILASKPSPTYKSIFPIRCSWSLNTSPWSARSSFTPPRGCSRSLRRNGSSFRRGTSRSLHARWACWGMGREPGLHVQGHGRGVRATARAFCVWRGHHHDEHGRGGNHLQLVRIPYILNSRTRNHNPNIRVHFTTPNKHKSSFNTNTATKVVEFDHLGLSEYHSAAPTPNAMQIQRQFTQEYLNFLTNSLSN